MKEAKGQQGTKSRPKPNPVSSLRFELPFQKLLKGVFRLLLRLKF